MEFTKENWENAPEGARLEWSANVTTWVDAHLVGFTLEDDPVIEEAMAVRVTHCDRLRIILPKRRMTVRLWRTQHGQEVSCVGVRHHDNWTLLGEHTFEIEGE